MSATRVALVKLGMKLRVNACGLAIPAKSAKTASASAISALTLTTVLAKIAERTKNALMTAASPSALKTRSKS